MKYDWYYILSTNLDVTSFVSIPNSLEVPLCASLEKTKTETLESVGCIHPFSTLPALAHHEILRVQQLGRKQARAARRR